MKNIDSFRNMWSDVKDKLAGAWKYVSIKAYKEQVKLLEETREQIKGLQIDIEALKIKIASTEIDLKASEIEREGLKIQLEEKKMQLVDLRLKLNQIESTNITSDIEVEQLIRKIKYEENEKKKAQQKLHVMINMLLSMAQDEKYYDIIKIQTNSISEEGEIKSNIYLNYNDHTLKIDQEDMVLGIDEEEKSSVNDKIIDFNSEHSQMSEKELMELAE